jgi:hypothetical protein
MACWDATSADLHSVRPQCVGDLELESTSQPALAAGRGVPPSVRSSSISLWTTSGSLRVSTAPGRDADVREGRERGGVHGYDVRAEPVAGPRNSCAHRADGGVHHRGNVLIRTALVHEQPQHGLFVERQCVHGPGQTSGGLLTQPDVCGIVHCSLLAARPHDINHLTLLIEGFRGIVPADKGFIDLQLQQQLAQQQGVSVVTPRKKNMKTSLYPVQLVKTCARWRRLVETMGSHLTERFGVDRLRVHDLWHYQHRLLRKVLAHTVAVFLNLKLGRQPLNLDGLVAS